MLMSLVYFATLSPARLARGPNLSQPDVSLIEGKEHKGPDLHQIPQI